MMNNAFVINLHSKDQEFREVQEAFLPYGIKCERYVVTPDVHKQIGCTMTHLEMIAHAKKEGRPYLFVIEDDCIPGESAKEWPVIAEFLHHEQKRWDIFLGGALFVYPKKLITNFPSSKIQHLNLIECSDAVTSHFAIYNSSAYDRLLTWYDLPLPLEKRPNIDNLFANGVFRIWAPSPFVALQKPHSNCDWTDEFIRAERKLQCFSQEMKKSFKYELLRKWMKSIS